MPTYEYVCRNCGRQFEVVQSFSEEALTICDECGGELRKVFTPPAISFKGSGFYATDHGKKKPASESKDAKSESGEKKSETKSEPAPKKDAGAKPKEEAST